MRFLVNKKVMPKGDFMRGKIILNLAMSLYGYIADEKGGFDWISWRWKF